MTVNRYLRMIAGAFVMLTLALGYWVSPYCVSVYGIRRAQPVPIRFYRLVSYLVSYDDDSSQVWD
jgi:hypothetical protein